MDSAEIYKALWQYYYNSDYKIANSFIFNWECDFFFCSKSGYAVEVEVKISRSDFKADFKKGKHLLFDAIYNKKSHFIYRGSEGFVCGPPYRGKLWMRTYIDRRLPSAFDGRSRDIIHNAREPLGSKPDSRWELKEEKIIEDFMQDKYPCTNIHIKKLDNIFLPHKFLYAVPDGLITPDEVPPYAGLIYLQSGSYGNGFKVIKKPPFLHKRDIKNQLTPVLRDKFYWLSVHQRDDVNNARHELKVLDKKIAELESTLNFVKQKDWVPNWVMEANCYCMNCKSEQPMSVSVSKDYGLIVKCGNCEKITLHNTKSTEPIKSNI